MRPQLRYFLDLGSTLATGNQCHNKCARKYIGEKKTADILVDGLKRLEYRGYDSCGVALIDQKQELYLKRVSGRVDALDKLIAEDPLKKSAAGIGTRTLN